MTYTVWAYSPSLNQEHRQVDLSNQQNLTEQQAQRAADSFAHIYNRDRKLNAVDWRARVKNEQLGIATLPGYLFSR